MNERTHFFIKNISLTLYSRKGWCWLCVRGELETGTDCSILTPSSSDHSSTSFALWLDCSTMGHCGPKASAQFGILFPTDLNWLKPSVAPGYIIVLRSTASCERTHLPSSPNSTPSTGQGDIPISSTKCTSFAVLPLIYTGAFLDWRLGRGSICYNRTLQFFRNYSVPMREICIRVLPWYSTRS